VTVRASRPASPEHEIIIFDSPGMAIEDVAAASIVS